jgi:hypothetical protein
MVMFLVVPGKETLAETAGIFDGSEALGKMGRYLRVLKWDSEKGLSSLV